MPTLPERSNVFHLAGHLFLLSCAIQHGESAVIGYALLLLADWLEKTE